MSKLSGKYFGFLLLFLSMAFSSGAQVNCASELTEYLYSRVGKQISLDKAKSGETFYYEGYPLSLRVSQDNVLENIGFDILSPETESLFPSHISSFLERYALEIMCWNRNSLTRKLKDDGIDFLTGYAYDVIKLKQSDLITLSLLNDKKYLVEWKRDGVDILSYSFPANFELILGKTRSELDKDLLRSIRCSGLRTVDHRPSEYVRISEDIYTSFPVNKLYIKSLTDASYYRTDTQGNLQPVFDSLYPAESIANLLLGELPNDALLQIRQSIYGYNTSIDYEVGLGKWLDYCSEVGLELYFAIEDQDDSSLKILVIARSPELGYNHLLSISTLKTIVTEKCPVIKVRLNAYIPTYNVSQLLENDNK